MASKSNLPFEVSEGQDNEKREDRSFELKERSSLELVIALTGPVGSGVSTVSDILMRILAEEFDYTPHYIKLSELIRIHAGEVGVDLTGSLSPSDRVDAYQNAGNLLRDRRSSYLADRAIERINALRRASKGVLTQEGSPDIPVQKRLAYVIDSLKNPEEVKRLRQIYGDIFWHVTVFAPDEVREKRLVSNAIEETSVRHIMKKDQSEAQKTGQQVSKTAHLADYFIRNHSNVVESVHPSVRRFLDVIFGTILATPTKDEVGMMKAASAAVQSACMSRQVGAAIYSSAGELVGVGCNDVPKAGGGLYSADLSEEEDMRCHRWGAKICHNDDRKQRLAASISKDITDPAAGENARRRAYDIVVNSESKNLIEFSRSVHAEMEAIVSVARSGRGSTLGGTLFTTTFPCHNCARHIVAAGIDRVVFVEPYSKSLALKLHEDSITQTDETGKVRFVQYEGFAPRASMRVFSSVGRERKDDAGKFIALSRRSASPLFPHPLDSYMSSEELVIQELVTLQGGNDGKEEDNAR
jgi:deoxycytidylate deaminase